MSENLNKQLMYKNADGEELHFGSGCLHYNETELFNTLWTFETEGQRIKTRKLEARTATFPVVVSGGSLEERNEVYRILETDTATERTGTLYYGEWSIPCVATAQNMGHWWLDDGLEDRELTLLFPRPLWVREELNEYFPTKDPEHKEIPGGDYPKPYKYGYARGAMEYTINVDTIGDAEFLWRVWGAAHNPYIIIDDNRYEVDVTVPEGSRLEVDTRARTIKVIDGKGREIDALDNRVRGADGSGSYIFRRIPRGDHVIGSSRSLCFDIILYNERTQPPWHE